MFSNIIPVLGRQRKKEMKHTYIPRGVCSRRIDFELRDGKVHNLSFAGGCEGNLRALGRLTEGMEAEKVIELLEGNQCGHKGTSCADQLTKGLRQALAEEQ
jgi:uncharacterized protein (TIGR03905 family)